MSDDLYDVATPVDVKFDVDAEDVEKVLEAERLLQEAGVEFDAGMPLDDSPKAVRVWHLDGIGSSGYTVEPKSEDPTHKDDEGGSSE